MMRFWIGVVLLLCGSAALAHPLAPALLDLQEAGTAADGMRYAALWRTSITRLRGAELQPRFPADCREQGPAQLSSEENQSWVRRWTLVCAAPLPGRPIRIEGIERSGINVILRYAPSTGAATSLLLDADQAEALVPRAAAARPVFRDYFALGVEHLLLGLDHVLLVLGLVLLVRRLRALVLTVTAFTLGHSVTLALASLGIVAIDPRLTEFAIALSVLYLAVEILLPAASQSLMRRRPWQLATLFGLLHGLGFAGALAEVGLPAGEIPLALLAFNLGIEAGQLALIALLLGAGALYSRVGVPGAVRRLAALAPVYLIGSLAAYWCIERAVLIVAA